MTAGESTLLIGAGVVAGVIGTAGGITSLISYPALLAAGLTPLAANLANLVAVVACWPGAALSSRPELAGCEPWLRRWTPISALGGAAGAALLLSTPSGAFGHIVPLLVAVGALALLAQPCLATRQQHRRNECPSTLRRVLPPLALIALTVYNGYFGAGSGVMILALLMTTVDPRLPTANALKNMLLGAGALISAAAFAVLGHVDWAAALPLGGGLFIGSTVGPTLARRVPADLLRWLVGVLGIALAVRLWIEPGG
jgi:uncharacterized membrane protein YfcA